MKKIEAWVADDESLHTSEDNARWHNLEVGLLKLFERRDEYGGGVSSAYSARDRVLKNLDEFWDLLNAHKSH